MIPETKIRSEIQAAQVPVMPRIPVLSNGPAWEIWESTMRCINWTRNITHKNLLNRYQLQMSTDQNLEQIFASMQTYFESKNRTLVCEALSHYNQIEPFLLRLWWCAATDATIRESSVDARINAFSIALENSIRGNNRNIEEGPDAGKDKDDGRLNNDPICEEGLANQLALCMQESYDAQHPDNVYVPDIPQAILGWFPQQLLDFYADRHDQKQIKEAVDALVKATEEEPASSHYVAFFNDIKQQVSELGLERFYIKHSRPESEQDLKQVNESLQIAMDFLHYTNLPDAVTSGKAISFSYELHQKNKQAPNVMSAYHFAKRPRAMSPGTAIPFPSF